jgi:hypothetical protein
MSEDDYTLIYRDFEQIREVADTPEGAASASGGKARGAA